MKERKNATIKIYDTNGNSIKYADGTDVEVLITQACKRMCHLMEYDYIELSFLSAEVVHFPVGAYCDDEIFGRFYLTQEYVPSTDKATGGYKYDMRMDAWYYLWNLKQIMLVTSVIGDGTLIRKEIEWSLTGSLKEHMREFMKNLQVLGFVPSTCDFMSNDTDLERYVHIDETAEKAGHALNITYKGTYMVDGVFEIAKKFETECWISGTESDFQINFGKCEQGQQLVLNSEKNEHDINVETLVASRDTANTGEKIHVFGSEKNIPYSYRKNIAVNFTDYVGVYIPGGSKTMTRDWYLTLNKALKPHMFPFSPDFDLRIDQINEFKKGTISEYIYRFNKKIGDVTSIIRHRKWGQEEYEQEDIENIPNYITTIKGAQLTSVDLEVDPEDLLSKTGKEDKPAYDDTKGAALKIGIELYIQRVVKKNDTVIQADMLVHESCTDEIEYKPVSSAESKTDRIHIPLDMKNGDIHIQDKGFTWTPNNIKDGELWYNVVIDVVFLAFSYNREDDGTGGTTIAGLSDVVAINNFETSNQGKLDISEAFSDNNISAPLEIEYNGEKYDLEITNFYGDNKSYAKIYNKDGEDVTASSLEESDWVGRTVYIEQDLGTDVPYAFFTNKYDDPSSLYSVGTQRLQLPIPQEENLEDYTAEYDGETLLRYRHKSGKFYLTADKTAFMDESLTLLCRNGYVVPIDKATAALAKEISVAFEETYPDGKLIVDSVINENKQEVEEFNDDRQRATWNWIQYHLQLKKASGTPFLFSKKYILDGYMLGIRFLTPNDIKDQYPEAYAALTDANCKLAGMQFEAAFNNSVTYKGAEETEYTTKIQDYAVVRNDDFGAKLPNTTLKPTVGDPCCLINWNVKAMAELGLIDEAEKKLLIQGFEYYKALKEGNTTFECTMMSDWMFDLLSQTLNLLDSQNVQLKDADGNDLKVRQNLIPLLDANEKLLYDYAGKLLMVKNDHIVYMIPTLGQKVLIHCDALDNTHRETRVIGYELKLDKPYDSPKYICGETEIYSRLKELEKQVTKLNK